MRPLRALVLAGDHTLSWCRSHLCRLQSRASAVPEAPGASPSRPPPRPAVSTEMINQDEMSRLLRSAPSLTLAPSPLNRVPLTTRAVKCATSLRHRSVEANAKFSHIIVLPGAPYLSAAKISRRAGHGRERSESRPQKLPF